MKRHTNEENDYRVLAVMHDGTVIEKNCTWKQDRSDTPFYWLSEYETVQMANLVVCVHLRSGRTEVIKNRWGNTGEVKDPRAFIATVTK